MTAILYSFRRCPYAMRARMALHVSGIAYQHREVALRDKPAAMLEASPKGTVPVFITQGGEVIDESLTIALYALGRHDPRGWLDEFDADLTAQNDGDFKHHLDRYKYASRYKDDAARGDIDLSHRQKAEVILCGQDQSLAAQAFLSGDTQSFTDISIFPFIRQFAAVEPNWFKARFPSLSEWLSRHVESDLFKTIMTKHPLWDATAQ